MASCAYREGGDKTAAGTISDQARVSRLFPKWPSSNPIQSTAWAGNGYRHTTFHFSFQPSPTLHIHHDYFFRPSAPARHQGCRDQWHTPRHRRSPGPRAGVRIHPGAAKGACLPCEPSLFADCTDKVLLQLVDDDHCAQFRSIRSLNHTLSVPGFQSPETTC